MIETSTPNRRIPENTSAHEWFKTDKLQQLVNNVDAMQTVKLCDLIVDQKYSVDKLKAVNTKFERHLIAYLYGEFCVFLACRFGTLTDEDVCELNNGKLGTFGCVALASTTLPSSTPPETTLNDATTTTLTLRVTSVPATRVTLLPTARVFCLPDIRVLTVRVTREPTARVVCLPEIRVLTASVTHVPTANGGGGGGVAIMSFKCNICEGSYSKLSNLNRQKHQCHQTPPNPAHKDACWDEEVFCSALDLIEKEEHNRVKCLNELEKNKGYNVVLSEEASNEPNVIALEGVGRVEGELGEVKGVLRLRTAASCSVVTLYAKRPSEEVRAACSLPNGEGSNQFKKCGFVDVQPTPLITKGQKTSRGQWPWHTALYQSKGIDLSYICGGSLISSKAVITGLRSVQPEWGVEARHMLDQSVKGSKVIIETDAPAHCVTRLVADQPVDPDTLVVYLGKYHLKLWSEGGVQDKQFDSFTVMTAISIQNKKRIHVHLTRNLIEELAYIRVYEYGDSTKKTYRLQTIVLTTQEFALIAILEQFCPNPDQDFSELCRI
uniref:Peptidase S1 domain-containing protein n=1 Tax=Timema douglasi TaxID=61478 RepID=A0A7R8VJX2_TIMDO|nr:unnamed protein product [Timema douglasi]